MRNKEVPHFERSAPNRGSDGTGLGLRPCAVECQLPFALRDGAAEEAAQHGHQRAVSDGGFQASPASGLKLIKEVTLGRTIISRAGLFGDSRLVRNLFV